MNYPMQMQWMSYVTFIVHFKISSHNPQYCYYTMKTSICKKLLFLLRPRPGQDAFIKESCKKLYGGYNWGNPVNWSCKWFNPVNWDILGITWPIGLKFCVCSQNGKIWVHTKFQPNRSSGSQDIPVYRIEPFTGSVYRIASIISTTNVE